MSDKNKEHQRVLPDSYYKSMEEFVREQEVKRLLEKARVEEAAQAEAASCLVIILDVLMIILGLLIFVCLLPLIDY